MKIRHFYARNQGPLRDLSLDFTKPLSEETESLLLLSGPNGSGKTALLHRIAVLWNCAPSWFTYSKRNQPLTSEKLWSHYGVSIIIDSPLQSSTETVGLFFGSQDYLQELQLIHPDIIWLGQIVSSKHPEGELLPIPDQYKPFLNKWAEERNRLVLTPNKTDTANMIHLDAERRRWVNPKKNVGDLIPDDYRDRWLTEYDATENWKGQLEAGLINLKIVDAEKYQQIIADMNKCLVNKQIDPTIHEKDRNRLRVYLKHAPQEWHYLDALSAGERQALIMIYIISRWLEEGGVVLIDEPDLHLHPSLIKGLLGQIESLVKQRNGQLLITSHNLDIWKRYKAIGRNILLGEYQPQTQVDEELDAELNDLDQWLGDRNGKLDETT